MRRPVYVRGVGAYTPLGETWSATADVLATGATAIRARMAAQRSLVGWVPERVGDYISGLQLYRSNTE